MLLITDHNSHPFIIVITGLLIHQRTRFECMHDLPTDQSLLHNHTFVDIDAFDAKFAFKRQAQAYQ